MNLPLLIGAICVSYIVTSPTFGFKLPPTSNVKLPIVHLKSLPSNVTSQISNNKHQYAEELSYNISGVNDNFSDSESKIKQQLMRYSDEKNWTSNTSIDNNHTAQVLSIRGHPLQQVRAATQPIVEECIYLVYEDRSLSLLNYNNNEDICFIININYLVFLSWSSNFDIEYHSRCWYDYLKVYEAVDTQSGLGSYVGRYCGQEPPSSIAVDGPIKIVFHTDRTIRGRGFGIFWATEYPTPTPGTIFSTPKYLNGCTHLTASSGVVMSPNYPMIYVDNLDHCWIIEGEIVTLTFDTNFHIENQNFCLYDYIWLMDSEGRGPRFCGSTAPGVQIRQGPVSIRFKTDYSLMRTGFRFSYAVSTGTIAPPPPATCGRRSVAIPRIVGGSEAVPGSWPWQLGINANEHSCGATILSRSWAVTAGHCVDGALPESVYIFAGQHLRDSNSPTVAYHSVHRIIIHDNYYDAGHLYDIALLKLNEDIQFNDFVQPACIRHTRKPVGSQSCWTTGWGETENEAESNQVLREAQQTITPCWNLPNPTLVCAIGAQGESACYGDSGGPLVCEAGGVFFLEGITSHGNSCSEVGAFSSISYFLDWIVYNTNGDVPVYN